MSKYGVFSSPYFPVFGLNSRKNGPENTPYLDTFHAVKRFLKIFDGVFWIPEFLDSGRTCWTLGSGRWTMDSEGWIQDPGFSTLDAGIWMLDSGHWTLPLTGSEQNQVLI